SFAEVSTGASVATSDRLTWVDVTEDYTTEFVAEGNVTVAPDGTVSADQVRGRSSGARQDNTQEAVRDSASNQAQTARAGEMFEVEIRSSEDTSTRKVSSPDWKFYAFLGFCVVLLGGAFWICRKLQ